MNQSSNQPFNHSTTQPILPDFVFGGIESDENRLLANERARWQGIRHEQRIEPADPEPGQPLTLTVTVGPDVRVEQMAAYVTVGATADGGQPTGSRGVATTGFAIPLHRVETRWENLIWDYVEAWQGEIPGQAEGTLVHYTIEGWRDSFNAEAQRGKDAEEEQGLNAETQRRRDAEEGRATDTHATNTLYAVRNTPSHWSREVAMDGTIADVTLYGYSVDRWATPAWAREAVVYQIFVDRFAKGETGAAVKTDWLEVEEMTEFMGGDLPGITARLEYIAGLGVSAVWLTPIFTAAEYHAYDTIDYTEIDPRFGTKADLTALVEKAHDLGLRVILDFVANHTSDRSPLFQAALADEDSPYRGWFSFGPHYKHGYRTFFSDATMPQFDTDSPAARRYLCDAAAYWLREFDVDGYRLDYAAGPSHSFWSEFAATCRAAKADCWLFGEVTRAGDLLRAYAGQLDGCLDFDFLRWVRQLCLGENPTSQLSHFVAHIERTARFFPADFSLPAFLDNHDTNRFLWMAGNDPARLRLGLGLLFGLGGSPILYYGTEVGLSQPRHKGPWREESRHPMLWDARQDGDMLRYTKELIGFRRSHPALVYGEVVTRLLDEERGVWLAERCYGEDRVWIGINVGKETALVPMTGDAENESVELQPMTCRLWEA